MCVVDIMAVVDGGCLDVSCSRCDWMHKYSLIARCAVAKLFVVGPGVL